MLWKLGEQISKFFFYYGRFSINIGFYLKFFSFQISAQRMEVCNRVDRMSYVVQRAAAAVAASAHQPSGSGTASSVGQSQNTNSTAAPLIVAANAAAVAAAAAANQQQQQQNGVPLQPDFSNLFHHYNAITAGQIANPAAAVAAAAAAPYMGVYQPLAAVLPYCNYFFLLDHLNFSSTASVCWIYRT